MTAQYNAIGDKGGALSALAAALAPYLRNLLGSGTATPEYYSQNDSPLGRRRHLELAREGTLPNRKVGRQVLVRRDDMHSFIDSHESIHADALPDTDGEEASSTADVLADWGLHSKDSR